jgi:hypothetical protein
MGLWGGALFLPRHSVIPITHGTNLQAVICVISGMQKEPEIEGEKNGRKQENKFS